ncbi:MAG: Nif3-like dinuclear metal center hexameric protein [Armatimonadetes bacterium]|nr:Nif3-like dinuclear metal center hexameric protein [Armatimonadota bacterium]
MGKNREAAPIPLLDIVENLERSFPPDLAESWDNVGLQTGRRERKIRNVLISLDVVSEVLEEARTLSADLLLTHHPLIFHPISSVDEDKPQGRLLADLIRKKIALYSLHTNLDSAPGGLNDFLASLLDLRDIRPLCESPRNPLAGLGRIGKLGSGMTVKELMGKLGGKLGLREMSCPAFPDTNVRVLALCTGSGGRLVEFAVAQGADAFLTGEIGYHEALLARESGLAVLACGHFQTERISIDLLAAHLEAAFPGLLVFRSQVESDPFVRV